MPDTSAHDRPATVWMDVTTSWRNRTNSMNGTLRIEQGYGAALAKIIPENLRFCRYNPTQKRFLPVAALPIAGRQEVPVRDREIAAAAPDDRTIGVVRKVERIVRRWRRSAAAGAFRFMPGFGDDRAALVESRAGDVLLLAGETWSRHDFSVLRSVRQNGGVRIAVVCQDLIPVKFPQFFDGGDFPERFRRYADFLINDVDLVIAISEQTRNDILEYAGAHNGLLGDIRTIELGHDVDDTTHENSPPTANPDFGKFVLSVSTIQSRKNFGLLYQLWRRLSEEKLPNLPKLVIVGRPGFGSRDLLWQIKHDPAVRDCMVVYPGVSDATLSRLYRDCIFTLYPSFYEGWGLPVSESLAHGKFCIASNTPALEEAGQGLVRHIDPLDFAAWQSAIVELVGSPDLISQFERRIRERYRAVTWRQSAERLANMLRTPQRPHS